MISKFHVAAIVFLVMTVLTTFVALLTPSWWQISFASLGLWTRCYTIHNVTSCVWYKTALLEMVPGWVKASITLYTLACIICVVATVWEIVSLFTNYPKDGKGQIVSAALMGLACVMTFTTVSLVGGMAHTKLGTRLNQRLPEPILGGSYWVAVVSVFLCLATIILLAKVRIDKPRNIVLTRPPEIPNIPKQVVSQSNV